jgi:hypothetical protein
MRLSRYRQRPSVPWKRRWRYQVETPAWGEVRCQPSQHLALLVRLEALHRCVFSVRLCSAFKNNSVRRIGMLATRPVSLHGRG